MIKDNKALYKQNTGSAMIVYKGTYLVLNEGIDTQIH